MLLQSCSDDFADRWAALLHPLRELEGPAFVDACEDIRARFIDSDPCAT